MAEACLRHNTVICADEIHCDLVFADARHVPIASLAPEIAQQTITLMAPSKTYNIAGLHCSLAIIQNETLGTPAVSYLFGSGLGLNRGLRLGRRRGRRRALASRLTASGSRWLKLGQLGLDPLSRSFWQLFFVQLGISFGDELRC